MIDGGGDYDPVGAERCGSQECDWNNDRSVIFVGNES